MNSISAAPILRGTRVLVRCDIDVPIKDGIIEETYRLDSLLPTLNFLKKKEAKIIIAGHMGKPKGTPDPTLSTQLLQPYFEEKLGKWNFELWENLRFDPQEEANDPEFAQKLAQNADVFVNESFATCHRKHASIVQIPKFLPSYAGFRLEEEVSTLSKILKDPQRPLITIIGGIKIESKLPVINKFLEVSDAVLIGGRLGLEWKDQTPDKLFLPKDYANNSKDIGQKTIEGYREIIHTAKTILWAGPMGAYEEPEFSMGTEEIARAVVNSAAYSVIGGGDTIAAVNKIGIMENFDFASTGGGAMLEFLVKGTLPGLEVLGYQPNQ